MKWLIPSIYNAQGSRPIIVGVVQLGIVKIYVTAEQWRRSQEKWKTGWNLVYHQNWWFSEFDPPLNATSSVLFKESHPVYGQTQGSGVLYFSYFTDNSIVLCFGFLKKITPIPIYCFLFFVCSSLLLIIIFWVPSYIICLICLPHFLLQRFLMIMAFFILLHIVVSNPKLFWSIGEGSVGRTFRFSSPPLGLKEKNKRVP
jgi:hypothetical protein